MILSDIRQFLRDLKGKSATYMAFYNFVSRIKVYLLRVIPDVPYVKLRYFMNFGKRLNLKDPKTFNEKIQWLLLYDHKTDYITYVDKIKVKNVIDGILGKGYTIPTLKTWDNVDDIDINELPDQFVLKCNHDSGSVFICRNKSDFNIEEVKNKLKRAIKTNYYWGSREWPYKNVKPMIFAEQYLEESSESRQMGITDYKFFVFNGKAKMLYISKGLEDHTTASISFYDLTGKELPFHRKDFKPIGESLKLPDNYEEMLRVCTKIAEVINNDFVRIDLYSVKGKVYFSELTFYPCGTGIPFKPEEWDLRCGEMLMLHQK